MADEQARRMCPLSEVNDASSETPDRDFTTDRETSSSQLPDGGLAWVVLAGGTVSFFIMVALVGNMSLLYTYMLERFEESAERTAWVVSIHFGLRFFSAPVCGAFINKVGLRPASVVAGIIIALGLILSSLGQSLVYSLWGIGVIAGIGGAIGTIILFSLPGIYFDNNRGKATSILSSGGSIFGVMFIYFMRHLRNEYGFSGLMLIMGGLMLNISACGGLFAPAQSFFKRARGLALVEKVQPSGAGYAKVNLKLPDDEESANESENTSKGLHNNKDDILQQHWRTSCIDYTDGEQPQSFSNQLNFGRGFEEVSTLELQTLASTVKPQIGSEDINRPICSRQDCSGMIGRHFDWHLFKDSKFVLLGIYVVLFHFSSQYPLTFMVDTGKDKGLTEDEVMWMFLAQGVVSSIARLGVGFVLDMRLLQKYKPFVFALCGLFMSISIATVPATAGPAMYTALVVVVRIFAAMTHTQYIVAVVDTVGTDRVVSANSILRLFIGGFIFVSPAMGGMFKDTYGSYDYGYFVSAAILGATSIVYGGVHMHWHIKMNTIPIATDV